MATFNEGEHLIFIKEMRDDIGVIDKGVVGVVISTDGGSSSVDLIKVEVATGVVLHFSSCYLDRNTRRLTHIELLAREA